MEKEENGKEEKAKEERGKGWEGRPCRRNESKDKSNKRTNGGIDRKKRDGDIKVRHRRREYWGERLGLKGKKGQKGDRHTQTYDYQSKICGIRVPPRGSLWPQAQTPSDGCPPVYYKKRNKIKILFHFASRTARARPTDL